LRTKRIIFPNRALPYLLLAPQLAVTLVFFIWPAAEALYQSLWRRDPFGFGGRFVWFDNFTALLADPAYLGSFRTTLVFSAATTILSMGIALALAVAANRVVRGTGFYRTVLILPYAVAPAIAGALWFFLFNPTIGIAAYALKAVGVSWNHYLNGTHAMVLVVIASAWKQISYNFLFFLAALQSIPRSLLEAAAIDGARPVRRFWTIVFPLLSPTTFFLLVVNVVYAFFETFGVIHATTQGGPGPATTTLVFKVYLDGFKGVNLGSSAAQSVVLMAIVIALTAIQFRFVERRVTY
jgi:sn-glycerol 3-phosphate transport system permease protein